MQKYLYLMVGMPACGKSTWVEQNFFDGLIISSDAIIEFYAKSEGKTYDQVFSKYIDKASKQFFETLQAGFEKGLPKILVDRTNLSFKSRKKILDMVPKDYKKIAIVVTCSEATQDARLAARPGKSIPRGIIKSMRETFRWPVCSEGFDDITFINSDQALAA